MSVWKRVGHGWRARSITAKFYTAFGSLLALTLLVATASYLALGIIQDAQATILTSAEIQRLILETNQNLEKARRLQRDFFLRYPRIGVAQAYETFALPASDRIAHVIRNSSEIRRLATRPGVSDALQGRDVDFNLYLAAASRYATTFAEAVDLVITLATDESGLQARLNQNADALCDVLETAGSPSLTTLHFKMRVLEKDFWITGRRSYMQAALNLIPQLRQGIKVEPGMDTDQKAQAFTYLDNYQTLANQIAPLEEEIHAKLQDFDLQAESIDPISTAFTTLAHQGVEYARVRIDWTNQFTTILLVVVVLLGLAMVGGIAIMLNNSITRNIVRLTKAVCKLQDGNFDMRVEIDSVDELGKLATAFNQMAARIKQTLTEREALRQVGLEITAQLDLDTLLHSIVSQAVMLLSGVSGVLYLHRPRREVLESVVAVGPDRIVIGATLQKGEGLSGRVWESGEPLVVEDYKHWDGRAKIYQDHDFNPIVGVPIRWGDEFLGVLDVLVSHGHVFDAVDIELLSLFATQAAIAIKNASLYEQVQRHAEELETRVAERTSELQAANEQLKALTWLKDEFVSNVSHELRTPITSMKLYHDLLIRRPEKRENYLARLGREIDRLGGLIVSAQKSREKNLSGG